MEEFRANFKVIIPKEVNQSLNTIAARRGILKHEAIAEAIKEYVERHEAA